MIVDFARHRVAAGEDAATAIHDASMDRFRPIIMTTLAAVIGAVPIAVGFGADGASRRPLGLVIVGGLVVSQLITLYITPVIYLYLEEFQEKVLDRWSFLRASRSFHREAAAAGPVPPRTPKLPAFHAAGSRPDDAPALAPSPVGPGGEIAGAMDDGGDGMQG